MNQTLLALAGPTASGKTDWSLRLAKAIGGVVIVADSRTVYQGLDIGTGKVTSEYPFQWEKTSLGRVATINGIWHLGLDLVGPDDRFTAADFQRYVQALLPDIWALGKVPLLVGGTALYIDAVLRGYQFPTASALPPAWHDRRTDELFAELQIWDPKTAKTIDAKNRARLERALAYSFTTGKSLHEQQAQAVPSFRAQLYVIDRPRAELYSRIDARVDTWLADGLFDELRGLLNQGVTPKRLSEFGLVYREALNVVQGERTESEFKRLLAGKLHAFARRQLTWWRRNPDAVWVTRYTELETAAKRFIADAS